MPEPPAGLDPELETALKKTLQIVYKEHPLRANQILVLAAELQRVGIHRLVEEHLQKLAYRPEPPDVPAERS